MSHLSIIHPAVQAAVETLAIGDLTDEADIDSVIAEVDTDLLAAIMQEPAGPIYSPPRGPASGRDGMPWRPRSGPVEV